MPTFPVTGNKLKTIRQTAAGFDSSATADKTLAIVLKNDGYCFCVSAAADRKLLAVQADAWTAEQQKLHPAERLQQLLQTEPLPGKVYSRILVALESIHYTLVPGAVYQEGTGTDYYECVLPRALDEQLGRDSLKRTEAELIYGLPFGLSSAVRLHFPSASIRALVGAMTEYLQSTTPGGEHLFIHYTEESLQLWAYSGQKLHLLNRFKATVQEDILYHCLNTAKQLGFDQPPLHLLRSNSDQSSLLKFLSPHFISCDLIQPGEELNDATGMARLEKAALSDALALLCVS